MNSVTNRKVVIVEDDRNCLKLYSEILPEFGFDVISSVDGQDIENVIARERPLVAIFDLDLPVRSGQELAAAVRSHPAQPSAPLWVVSASIDQRQAERHGVEGFDRAYAKPVSVRRLLSDLEALASEAGRA
ncbi:response regulator [Caenispirillum salinarum]|uniref:response regulator n=1 Tax=Caenispirillum salinarum TaxID=859058 RepID=UPI00384E4319